MSADFWAGYISGAVGILIGNPLDILKVRLQTTSASSASSTSVLTAPAAAGEGLASRSTSLLKGTAAPVLGYGALNALLFVSYNRSLALLASNPSSQLVDPSSAPLSSTFIAGAIGGLATWIVSTPTELIKCRAQLSTSSVSSWAIARQILRTEGARGLYFGGTVTALRDSIGYGFYFLSYEWSTRLLESRFGGDSNGTGSPNLQHEAAKVLLCGGFAGVMTWASIFPLDVVKTRVQAQVLDSRMLVNADTGNGAGQPLLNPQRSIRVGAVQIAKQAYREGGLRIFFRGLAVCSVRAFFVNAVQWAIYEWVMLQLGQGRSRSAQTTASVVT